MKKLHALDRPRRRRSVDERPAQNIDKAITAFKKGDYEVSAAQFYAVLRFESEEQGNFAEAQYGLAKSFEKLGLPLAALKYYEDIVKVGNDHPHFDKAVEGLIDVGEQLNDDLKTPQILDAIYTQRERAGAPEDEPGDPAARPLRARALRVQSQQREGREGIPRHREAGQPELPARALPARPRGASASAAATTTRPSTTRPSRASRRRATRSRRTRRRKTSSSCATSRASRSRGPTTSRRTRLTKATRSATRASSAR